MMRKIYFAFCLLIGASCTLAHSMERNSLFRSSDIQDSVSNRREMQLEYSDITMSFPEDQVQYRCDSPMYDEIQSFDREKLTANSPFVVGLGHDGAEESISCNLNNLHETPIAIPAKEGVVIIMLDEFAKDINNIRSLCDELIAINISREVEAKSQKRNANNAKNLSSASQMNIIYNDQSYVIAHEFKGVLEERICLKKAYKNTTLFLKFIPYNDLLKYCAGLLKFIRLR